MHNESSFFTFKMVALRKPFVLKTPQQNHLKNSTAEITL